MPVWQVAFFVIPLLFLIAVSFFVVKNYRVEPGFLPENWTKVLGKPNFWWTYGYTFLLATISMIAGTLLAFPASYALAFKLSEGARRWAVFLLIIPFFTSYVVRIFAWMFLLASNGVVNGALSYIGLRTLDDAEQPVRYARRLHDADAAAHHHPADIFARRHRQALHRGRAQPRLRALPDDLHGRSCRWRKSGS